MILVSHHAKLTTADGRKIVGAYRLDGRLAFVSLRQDGIESVIERHSRFDVGHEIVLPERARSDHR